MLSQHRVVPAWVTKRREIRPNPLYRYYDSLKTFHDHLTKDDRIMIVRRTGGFGDNLIISCLLQRIHDMYPENGLSFACCSAYESLYSQTPWLSTIAAEFLTTAETILPERFIKSPLSKGYSVIEDVTVPCHAWERIFLGHNKTDGGLKWRNRLDMWSNWIGIYGYTEANTCIKISSSVLNLTRHKYFTEPGKLAIMCPIGSERMKTYTHYLELGRNLQRMGYNVYILAKRGEAGQYFNGTIEAKDFKEYLAIIQLSDLVVTVDTAALHAAGVFKKRAYGLFTFNDGKAYCKYYPTVTPIQLCRHPCLRNGCKAKTCYDDGSIGRISELIRSGE